MSQSPHHISLSRVLKIVLPLIVVAVAATYWWSSQVQSAAREESASNIFARMIGEASKADDGSMSFPDKDGDLVADSPDDPAACIEPDVIMFSFVAGEEESVDPDVWKELIAALSERTGKQVEYAHYSSVDEQLKALKEGQMHIAGLNTGTVPVAVRQSGFVPLCTFGQEDGSYGYRMQFLVPADSPIQKVPDIRGHKVTFTRPDSNSGFKAPLVYLMSEYKLVPERDYDWGFSTAHEESIRLVAANEIEVAPVASDMLSRAIDKGDIDEAAIRTIYESEQFPPATIGYVYNLTPELREAIRDTLLNFDWNGTGLQREFESEASRFVPVNYKDDWANTRRIERTFAQARQAKS